MEHSEGSSALDEEKASEQAGSSGVRIREIPNTKRYDAVTLDVVQYYREDSQ